MIAQEGRHQGTWGGHLENASTNDCRSPAANLEHSLPVVSMQNSPLQRVGINPSHLRNIVGKTNVRLQCLPDFEKM